MYGILGYSTRERDWDSNWIPLQEEWLKPKRPPLSADYDSVSSAQSKGKYLNSESDIVQLMLNSNAPHWK